MDKSSADAIVWISGILGTLIALSRFKPIEPWLPLSMSTETAAIPSKRVWVWSIGIMIVVFCSALVALNKASPAQWHPFHSTGGYTVQMPGDVTEQTFTKTVLGHEVVAWEVTAKDNDCVFITGYHNCVAGLRFDAALAADEFAKKTGTMLMETPVTVDGHNGSEVLIRTTDQHNVTARFFSNAGRTYFLMLSSTDETANDPNVQAFIPSFHFENASVVAVASASRR